MFYTFYNKIPQGTRNFFIIQNENKIPENTSKELVMFMPNMRFATNSISYSFVDCDLERERKMLDAFEIVTNKTEIINFYESQTSPMITIYCSKEKQKQRNNSFVAGEGGPNQILELDLYPLIIDGTIYIYDSRSQEECESPIVELHELMHVFGFDHITNKSTILYPYLDCKQIITDEIVNKLKELYSIEPKSDLTIKNLNASASGRYLNFAIIIHNRGLIKSENIALNIYDTKEKIDTYDLGDMDVGISQTLTITNMQLPLRPITDLIFEVTTSTPEFFYENNNITANVKK
jgi:hypothetical protein